MVIEALDLQNYRNYELLSMKFSDKTNILYGDNAQAIASALVTFGMVTTHRERLIFLKPYMLQARQSRIAQARTEKLLPLTVKKHI